MRTTILSSKLGDKIIKEHEILEYQNLAQKFPFHFVYSVPHEKRFLDT